MDGVRSAMQGVPLCNCGEASLLYCRSARYVNCALTCVSARCCHQHSSQAFPATILLKDVLPTQRDKAGHLYSCDLDCANHCSFHSFLYSSDAFGGVELHMGGGTVC